MKRTFLRSLVLAFALLPAVAAVAVAEPVKLKLAFFSSDRSHLFRSLVKPFVDAVNAEGKDRVQIEVSLSGKLGGDLTRQSQLLRDGAADIAYVVQPYEQARFPDSRVIELPGLFGDGREATLALTHLAATGTARDYADFFVIGAAASDPESIHGTVPIAALADLKGRRIRANNEVEIAVMKRLGAQPVILPINETAEALAAGRVDGAYVPPVPMLEFGIGRVASNHFFLRTSCVPISLLMRRQRFDGLTPEVRDVIRKYSGAWLVERYAAINASITNEIMSQLQADPKRKVAFLSPGDSVAAAAAFRSVVDDYAASDPHQAALVRAAKAVTAGLRQVD